MVGVEQSAEIRRLHFVRGLSKREISRRTGLARDTVDRAVRSKKPPAYQRAPAGSKLDPFKDEIHRLLKSDSKLPGQRIRELIAPLGFEGGKTIVDGLSARGSAAVRAATTDVSADGLTAGGDLPVRSLGAQAGDSRRSRADAPGMGRRCVRGLLACECRRAGLHQADPGSDGRSPALFVVAGALPQTLVWGRQAGIHGPTAAARATSSARSAGSCASTGGSARQPIRRRRASSSACRRKRPRPRRQARS